MKLLRSLLIALVLLLLLVGGSVYLALIWGERTLAEKGVFWDELSFSLDSGLSIKGVLFKKDTALNLELSEVVVEPDWSSIIKGDLRVSHIGLNGLDLKTFYQLNQEPPDTSAQENDGSFPLLEVDLITLRNISVDLNGRAALTSIRLDSAILMNFNSGDSLMLDSLILYSAAVATKKYEKELAPKQPDDGEYFSPKDMPYFRVDYLESFDGSYELIAAQNHKFSKANFQVEGWNNQRLLDAQMERFSFVYQDSIEVKLDLDEFTVDDTTSYAFEDVKIDLPGLDLNIVHFDFQVREEFVLHTEITDSRINSDIIKAFISAEEFPIDDSDIRLSTKVDMYGDQVWINSLELGLNDWQKLKASGYLKLGDPIAEADIQLNDIQVSRDQLELFVAGIDTLLKPFKSLTDIRIKLDSTELMVDAELGIDETDIKMLITSRDVKSLTEMDAEISLSTPRFASSDLLYTEDSSTLFGFELIADINDSLLTGNYELHLDSISYMDRNVMGLNLDITKAPDQLVLKLDVLKPAFQLKAQSDDFRGTEVPDQLSIQGELNAAIHELLLEKEDLGELKIEYVLNLDKKENNYLLDLEMDSISIYRSSPAYRWNDYAQLQLVYADSTMNADFALGEDIDLKYQSSGINDSELIDLSMRLDSSLMKHLSGNHIYADIPRLRLERQGDISEAELSITSIEVADVSLNDAKASAEWGASGGEFGLMIEELGNDLVSFSQTSFSLSGKDHKMQMTLHSEEADRSVNFNLELTGDYYLDSIIKFEIDTNSELLIAGDEWLVLKNRAEIDLINQDHDIELQIADSNQLIAINSIKSELYGKVENLKLDRLINLFSSGTNYQTSLNADYKNIGAQHQLRGSLFNFGDLEKFVDTVRFSSEIDTDKDQMTFDLKAFGQAAELSANIHSRDQKSEYRIDLSNFDLAIVDAFLDTDSLYVLKGNLSGSLKGNTDELLSSSARIYLTDISLKSDKYGLQFSSPKSTLVLIDSMLYLAELQVFDSESNKAKLSLEYHVLNSELSGEFKTDSFKVLNPVKQKELFSGELYVESDLKVDGDFKEVFISGDIGILEGGQFLYRNETEVAYTKEPSEVVFIDFDDLDTQKTHEQKAHRTHLNWDVQLSIAPVDVEILLYEKTQEFVKIKPGGEIKLANGPRNIPYAYGQISSDQGRAYVIPPVAPDLDLRTVTADLFWNGDIMKPNVRVTGKEIVKIEAGSITGSGRLDRVPVELSISLSDEEFSKLDYRFDLSSSDPEVSSYLGGRTALERQDMATQILIFGKVGEESGIASNAMLKNVNTMLNQVSRRNLKNTYVSVGFEKFDADDDLSTSDRYTALNYSLSRSLANDRASFVVEGNLGLSSDANASNKTHPLSNVAFNYQLTKGPLLQFSTTRVYTTEGLIDGEVGRNSVGLRLNKQIRSLKPYFEHRE